MKDKHEQLYVAVQDLLIELDISPKKLRFIATQPVNSAATFPGSKISTKTAQKLIDADLIVEEINWRQPGNVFGPHQETETNALPVEDYPLTTFNKIKSSLAPGILWSYLREEYPEVLSEQIKEYLFPTQ